MAVIELAGESYEVSVGQLARAGIERSQPEDIAEPVHKVFSRFFKGMQYDTYLVISNCVRAVDKTQPKFSETQVNQFLQDPEKMAVIGEALALELQDYLKSTGLEVESETPLSNGALQDIAPKSSGNLKAGKSK